MIFRFENFILDPEQRELLRGVSLRPVEPQVFDLLEYLIRHRERVVSARELFKAIWHDRVVSDSTLSTRVHAARAAIDDNGRDQRLIRTLRTKGLRFVGEVQEEIQARANNAPPKFNQLSQMLTARPLIAVLPFENIGGHHTRDDFADGMTEEAIIALSKSGWLSVAPRTACFAFKGKGLPPSQAARKLGAQYVLVGTVREDTDRVRVSAQLIDVVTGQSLWVERYDQNSSNRFASQDDLTDKILGAIEPQIYFAEEHRAKRSSPEALNAWECIVRGLSLMNSRKKPDVATARRFLQRAVRLDSNSAQAHGLLSIATTLGVHMGWINRRVAIPSALDIAQKALSLNPDEPWARAALGYAMIWKQPEDAIDPLEQALALNPNFAIGHYFHALASTYAGCGDHVFTHAALAERLARRDLLARGYQGAWDNVRATASFAREQYADGAKFARKAILELPNSPTGYRALVMNLALGGEIEDAKERLESLKRLAPAMSQSWIEQNSVWARREHRERYVEAFRLTGLR